MLYRSGKKISRALFAVADVFVGANESSATRCAIRWDFYCVAGAIFAAIVPAVGGVILAGGCVGGSEVEEEVRRCGARGGLYSFVMCSARLVSETGE